MSTVLFWLAVGAMLILYLTSKKNVQRRGLKKQSKRSQTLEATRCAQCGVFLPKEQAVRQHQHNFCSWEHAAQWYQENHLD